jgi:hypothetical protein
MQEYNLEGGRPALPDHGGLWQKLFLPKLQSPSAKAIPTIMGSTPDIQPTNVPFVVYKLPDGITSNQ